MSDPRHPQVLNSSGESLDFRYHPGDREDFLVILGHGVTGNMDRPLIVHLANQLSTNGWPSLRFSFAGNGNSEGEFSDSTITKEVDDLRCLIESHGKGRRLIYIGHSMGGAVGVIAASKKDTFDGLVSLAGMVDTTKFCETEFGEVTPDEGFMWDDEECPLSQAYVDDLHAIGDTIASARKVRNPWLLLHGSEDDVVPLQDSQTAYGVSEADAELVVIDGADHVFTDHLEPMSDEVLRWLQDHFG